MSRLPRSAKSAGDLKPKVLLVDDHRGILDRVSAMLAGDFDVAGTATDGRQALDVARRINPDVIVLDINMPGLNGFDTLRALERDGVRAPVVFLSTVDGDDHVSEAFRRGGRGYVEKLHLVRDLAGAIDQVLDGRMFVPTLGSLAELGHDGHHAMLLHEDADSFLDELAGFFDIALRRGDATCVIATRDVREGLEGRLQRRGWAVGGVPGHDRYRVIDADDALTSFMRNGLPDAALLAQIATELEQYRLAVADVATSRLTVFGNMVVRLIEDGNAAGAVALEAMWDSLTDGLPFFTLCAYSRSCFGKGESDLWESACAQHGSLSHSH
jgi:DNA-binding NarL/FixJ family response regulator